MREWTKVRVCECVHVSIYLPAHSPGASPTTFPWWCLSSLAPACTGSLPPAPTASGTTPWPWKQNAHIETQHTDGENYHRHGCRWCEKKNNEPVSQHRLINGQRRMKILGWMCRKLPPCGASVVEVCSFARSVCLRPSLWDMIQGRDLGTPWLRMYVRSKLEPNGFYHDVIQQHLLPLPL